MLIRLDGETRIRVELGADAGLAVESGDEHVHFSPLHMLAASLATCTLAVLVAWAEHAKLDLDGLAVDVEWDYVEEPYRVGEYRMEIRWPGLAEERRAAALRVARHCTVEHTLAHPPSIVTTIG